MKTAREIIAEKFDGYFAHSTYGPKFADAILAALAAEGFSIVETGRDPVTIECIACEDKPAAPNIPCAVCGRSTREGKT